MLSTWNDSLFEELLLQTGQETVNSLPGDFPQIWVACTGVCAVKDPCCVHHQQHVLQRLRDGLQLCTKVTHTDSSALRFNNFFTVNLWTSFLGVIDSKIRYRNLFQTGTWFTILSQFFFKTAQSSLYDFFNIHWFLLKLQKFFSQEHWVRFLFVFCLSNIMQTC